MGGAGREKLLRSFFSIQIETVNYVKETKLKKN